MREPNYYTFFTENVNDFFAFIRKFLIFSSEGATKAPLSPKIPLEKRVCMCYDEGNP
jgi:hypothetical protein